MKGFVSCLAGPYVFHSIWFSHSVQSSVCLLESTCTRSAAVPIRGPPSVKFTVVNDEFEMDSNLSKIYCAFEVWFDQYFPGVLSQVRLEHCAGGLPRRCTAILAPKRGENSESNP